MARAPQLTEKQQALLKLLRRRSGKTITTADVLGATGWRPGTWQVYLNKGLYAPYVQRRLDGRFDVVLDPSVDELDFFRQVTQSTEKRHPSAKIIRLTARRLVERSRDNMLLAIEVYNRPTLNNRMDGFAMLFCTAWEQLLKAEIIELRGDNAVYRPTKPARRRETLSLDECVGKLFDATDPVRQNLLRIAELRHAATHFLVPEIQAPLAYMFQSGVLNYARRFREVTGAPFLPKTNVGLLALAGHGEKVDASALDRLYGKDLGAEIAAFARTLEEEIDAVNDERFAVRIDITMRLTTSKDHPQVTLAKAAEAPPNAIVLEKPVDPERTHPYRSTELCSLVRERLGDTFTQHDLTCAVRKLRWKGHDSVYHRLQRNPDTPKYSLDAAEELVRLVSTQPNFLAGARESFAHSQREARRAKKSKPR